MGRHFILFLRKHFLQAFTDILRSIIPLFPLSILTIHLILMVVYIIDTVCGNVLDLIQGIGYKTRSWQSQSIVQSGNLVNNCLVCSFASSSTENCFE